MPSSPDFVHEIRKRLASYVGGEISLRDFQEWFVPVAWGTDARGNSAATSLVSRIELLLAEFSNGDWTEQELKHKLRSHGTPTEEDNIRVDFREPVFFQVSTNSASGQQPSNATRYIGISRPSGSPRIQKSQLAEAMPTP